MILHIDSSSGTGSEGIQVVASIRDDAGNVLVSDTFAFDNTQGEEAIVVQLQNQLQHKLGRVQAQAAMLAKFQAGREIILKTASDARAFLGLDAAPPA